jgi:hypothetical protein
MALKEFTKELSGKGKRVEGELIQSILYSLLISFGLFVILYFTRLRYIENFLPKYGFYLFFAILSYAVVFPSIRQTRAYGNFACMSGMMIGMTTGMVSGFLAGFFIGATNGMFYGIVFGMLIGIFMGVWNGKSCGIMGIMEGLMAGFMGGLMGAMTSVMLLNDHLQLASAIIFIICSAIIFSLNYMIYYEKKDEKRELKEDYWMIVLLSLILTGITIWLMVYGPRSALFA